MKQKIRVKIVGHLLIFCYGLMLAWMSLSRDGRSFEFFIFLLLITGWAGFIGTRKWTGKVLIPTGCTGIIYILYRLLFTPDTGEILPLIIFGMLSLTMMAFYHLPVLSQGGVGPGLYPWTILAIDDDRALLKLLETNFRRYGIFVLTAETGERGLSLAEQHKPDLIILDVILPKMKGRAVCARLKENAQTKDIPVIFLTAKNSMDDFQAEMAAGAHAHITKPVDFKDLFSQVKKILST